ncbi:CobW family GTP-binding protein [Ruegeria arenilitoris]|uniref:CobW family GTP-binding protein n=1 Tax=Ruegeria arenilitoris TaxID=1173585 RepID=UPI00147D6606|nr:GTP-binding protein [Ruegeria arenilitoris]
MKPLPLSVIGGYLGAGKTTLINRLLAADHGLRLTVLVNDFGAINIDARLLKSGSADTIELTNGCVCCTLSGDLYYAVGDILNRKDRPDHLLIEASGISDPAKIANVALAEMDLRYSGVLTVIDGLNFPQCFADHRISSQVAAQVKCADIRAISKTKEPSTELTKALENAGVTHWLDADDIDAIQHALFEPSLQRVLEPSIQLSHPSYATWSSKNLAAISETDLRSLMSLVPKGTLRLKAILPDVSGGCLEAHVVGSIQEIHNRSDSQAPGIIAIGMKNELRPGELEDWWNSGMPALRGEI